MLKNNRVIVVGAGVGGLVTALALAARGVDVLVLERAAQAGGKLRQVCVGGAWMDAGPTVFTMRWVFDELLAEAGLRLEDHLALTPLDVLARHAWCDGSRLDLFADIERSAAAIGQLCGLAEMQGYRRFCAHAAHVFNTLEGPFLRGTKPSPLSLMARVGLHSLGDLSRIAPFETLWKELGSYFKDQRLRQLFGRYATYCGSSPYLATATLMLVAHVEQQGVWLVDGGMQQVAAMLAGLAQRMGTRIRCDAHVAELVAKGGRIAGVRLADGECIEADAIVFNGDAGALASGLLGAEAAGAHRAKSMPARSLSALTFNLRARAEGFPLARHTVFFSRDYAAEFEAIFRHGRLPTQPTVYVCAQDRGAGDAATPSGPERLLCIVNAPPTGDTRTFTSEEVDRCQTQTFQLLTHCGLQLTHAPEQALVTTPNDFARMFPGTGGALYGPASHGWMASFSRPGARSRLPGLYLAGGSTHPGPGVPMAALSGRLAASSVLDDLASMRRSHPAAMRGGTSTR
jgi:1-hydroxycarotenoid 3,4-desaturase